MENSIIASHVQRCFDGFQKACISFSNASPTIKGKIHPYNLNDELGRFRLWCGNVAAHRRGRSSLDYKLREASHIQDRVVELLKSLETVIQEADEIISGDRVPWEDLSDSDSDTSGDNLPNGEDQDTDATELQQLASNMAETITCLMRLSMAIRNPAPHDQFKESSHIDTSHFETFDIEHVRGKFPHAAEDLVARLGKAISRRRQYLRYRDEHQKKLKRGLERTETIPVPVAEIRVPAPVTISAPSERIESTVASSIPLAIKASTTTPDLDENDFYEDTLSQTSYASSTNDSSKLRPPPLPEQGQDGDPFECPLCFRLTIVRQTSAWHKHVYRDLHPYVCSFRHCKIPDVTYESRHDWFNHEMQHRTSWVCMEGCNLSFQSRSDFREHFQIAHRDWSSEDRLDDLLRTCEKRASMDEEVDCPLCCISLSSLTQLRRHLGKHHEELSLFALPSSMKDDSDSANDDADSRSVSVGHASIDEDEDETIRCQHCGEEFFGDDRESNAEQHLQIYHASSIVEGLGRLDDGYRGTPPTQEHGENEKKAMLSRALQMAHTAVLMDNAENSEGAINAYGDACKLLVEGMIMSNEEDRRKMDAIRAAYTIRIKQLVQNGFWLCGECTTLNSDDFNPSNCSYCSHQRDGCCYEQQTDRSYQTASSNTKIPPQHPMKVESLNSQWSELLDDTESFSANIGQPSNKDEERSVRCSDCDQIFSGDDRQLAMEQHLQMFHSPSVVKGSLNRLNTLIQNKPSEMSTVVNLMQTVLIDKPSEPLKLSHSALLLLRSKLDISIADIDHESISSDSPQRDFLDVFLRDGTIIDETNLTADVIAFFLLSIMKKLGEGMFENVRNNTALLRLRRFIYWLAVAPGGELGVQLFALSAIAGRIEELLPSLILLEDERSSSQSVQKNQGHQHSEDTPRIQAIVDGREGAGTSAKANPPGSILSVARAIQSNPDQAVNISINDLEDIVQWLRMPLGKPSGVDNDTVRDALVKRVCSLESALSEDLKLWPEIALMHVQHEQLGKNYENTETMLGDDIKDIPRDKFWATEDNYAWDIEELTQAITANSGVMRNPLSKRMFTPKDIGGIINHPDGKQLAALKVEQNKMSKGVRPDTIAQMEKLSKILLDDQSSDTLPSHHAIDEFLAYIATLPELEQKCMDGLKCPVKDAQTGQVYDITIGEAVRDSKGNQVCFHKAGDIIKQAAVHLRKTCGSPPDAYNTKDGQTVRDDSWSEKAQQRYDTGTTTAAVQASLDPSDRNPEDESLDSQSKVDRELSQNESPKEGSTIMSDHIGGHSRHFDVCNHLYEDIFLFDSIENVGKLVCDICGNRSQMVKYCCRFCGLNVCSGCEVKKISRGATMGQVVISEENERMNKDAMAENARKAAHELLRQPIDSPKTEEPHTIDHSASEKDLPEKTYQFKVIYQPLAEQTRLTRIAKRLEDSKDKTEFWMPALAWRCIDYINFKGVDEKGLYQVPGPVGTVEYYKQKFDQDRDIDLLADDNLDDPNIIASLFKDWLHQLPGEIFPTAIQAKIQAECQGAKSIPQMLKDELSKLSPFNYYLLFATTCHISLLHSYSEVNKMNYNTLCICFQSAIKINAFCFQFLVLDWRNCWQGCWTEKEYLAEEMRLLGPQPTASRITSVPTALGASENTQSSGFQGDNIKATSTSARSNSTKRSVSSTRGISADRDSTSLGHATSKKDLISATQADSEPILEALSHAIYENRSSQGSDEEGGRLQSTRTPVSLWDPTTTFHLKQDTDGSFICSGITRTQRARCRWNLGRERSLVINDMVEKISTRPPESVIQSLEKLADACLCHHHKGQAKELVKKWTLAIESVLRPEEPGLSNVDYTTNWFISREKAAPSMGDVVGMKFWQIWIEQGETRQHGSLWFLETETGVAFRSKSELEWTIDYKDIESCASVGRYQIEIVARPGSENPAFTNATPGIPGKIIIGAADQQDVRTIAAELQRKVSEVKATAHLEQQQQSGFESLRNLSNTAREETNRWVRGHSDKDQREVTLQNTHVNTRSYTFTWEHPASEVYVTGSFDNWSKTVKLEKEGDVFKRTIELPKAQHHYKFVVDGMWCLNDSLPKLDDGQGNFNNILTAEDDVKYKPVDTSSLETSSSTTTGLAGLTPKDKSSFDADDNQIPSTTAYERGRFKMYTDTSSRQLPITLHLEGGMLQHGELVLFFDKGVVRCATSDSDILTYEILFAEITSLESDEQAGRYIRMTGTVHFMGDNGTEPLEGIYFDIEAENSVDAKWIFNWIDRHPSQRNRRKRKGLAAQQEQETTETTHVDSKYKNDTEDAKEPEVGGPRLTKAKEVWTQLSVNNIESVIRVAEKVHPDLPESDQVFAERIKLFPEGCLALIDEETDEFCGYAVSHPIRSRQPPALNCLLGEIAPDADQYYIHDLAILPKSQGRGLAQECIGKLFAVAKRFSTTSLVSVHGTAPFWGRFGFTPEEVDDTLIKKISDYGDDAIYLERKN